MFTGTTTECAPPGGAPPFGACNFFDCPVGYGCYGACKPYCDNTSECAATGGVCYEAKLGFNVCTRKCALHDANACGPGLGCVVLNYPQDTSITVTDCIPVGTSTTGCGIPNDCAPGYFCNSSKVCKKWCRIGFSDCSQCGVVNPPPKINGVQYGVCN